MSMVAAEHRESFPRRIISGKRQQKEVNGFSMAKGVSDKRHHLAIFKHARIVLLPSRRSARRFSLQACLPAVIPQGSVDDLKGETKQRSRYQLVQGTAIMHATTLPARMSRRTRLRVIASVRSWLLSILVSQNAATKPLVCACLPTRPAPQKRS